MASLSPGVPCSRAGATGSAVSSRSPHKAACLSLPLTHPYTHTHTHTRLISFKDKASLAAGVGIVHCATSATSFQAGTHIIQTHTHTHTHTSRGTNALKHTH